MDGRRCSENYEKRKAVKSTINGFLSQDDKDS